MFTLENIRTMKPWIQTVKFAEKKIFLCLCTGSYKLTVHLVESGMLKILIYITLLWQYFTFPCPSWWNLSLSRPFHSMTKIQMQPQKHFVELEISVLFFLKSAILIGRNFRARVLIGGKKIDPWMAWKFYLDFGLWVRVFPSDVQHAGSVSVCVCENIGCLCCVCSVPLCVCFSVCCCWLVGQETFCRFLLHWLFFVLRFLFSEIAKNTEKWRNTPFFIRNCI